MWKWVETAGSKKVEPGAPETCECCVAATVPWLSPLQVHLTVLQVSPLQIHFKSIAFCSKSLQATAGSLQATSGLHQDHLNPFHENYIQCIAVQDVPVSPHEASSVHVSFQFLVWILNARSYIEEVISKNWYTGLLLQG